MELRIILLVARLLDPRKWRVRLAQLGLVLGGAGVVWVRAVLAAEEVRAVRDARHVERDRLVHEEREREEARRLSA